MIQIVGVSITILLLSIILKNYNKSFAIILSVVGAIILFVFVSDKVSSLVDSIYQISENVSGIYEYIKLMLKVLGIVLITQFVSDLCRDNGENALASMIETSAKIIVVTLVLPLFETVISFVLGLLK